jgi:hypothetical protein
MVLFQEELVPYSHIPMELTSPAGRTYIPGVVKRGDSSSGAGIRGVPVKVNSSPVERENEALRRGGTVGGILIIDFSNPPRSGQKISGKI